MRQIAGHVSLRGERQRRHRVGDDQAADAAVHQLVAGLADAEVEHRAGDEQILDAALLEKPRERRVRQRPPPGLAKTGSPGAGRHAGGKPPSGPSNRQHQPVAA